MCINELEWSASLTAQQSNGKKFLIEILSKSFYQGVGGWQGLYTYSSDMVIAFNLVNSKK